MRLQSIFSLSFLLAGNFLLSQNLARLADSLKSGFRGLSVVDENIIWTSGRKGLVGNSADGGKTWSWNRVEGFESVDFRSLHAFDKKNAVIATAGFPAAILFTVDAGKSWTTAYSSNDSAMFFDGIGFWDNAHGMIFGDPVKGKMYLSETFDGGKTWKEIPFEDRPQLENGETAFAASGTTIRTLPGGHIYIATGGAVSRLWHSRDYGHHWEVFTTPILQGQSSQGIFSIAFRDSLHGIIVGGDYLVDTLKKNNCFLTNDGGKSWHAPKAAPLGYRSSVEYADARRLVATGTSGTDYSNDGGETWAVLISKYSIRQGSNTVKKLPGKKGADFFFCGGKDGFRKGLGFQ